MSSIQTGLDAIAREPANKPIIKRFFRFAIGLAVLPVLTYMFIRYLVQYAEVKGNGILSGPILGGLGSVLTVNIIIAVFAVLAVKERGVDERRLRTAGTREEEREVEGPVDERSRDKTD